MSCTRDRSTYLGYTTLALAAALAGPHALATEARGAVFATRDQALAEAFPGAQVERMSFVLDERQVRSVQDRARFKLESKLVSAYLGWRGDTLAGVAFFDSRIVRTMPGVFMVVVAPDSTVERVEVLAFHEPPDYLPPPRWLQLFERRRLDDGLWPRRDIRNLSGATLSASALAGTARLALALFQSVVAPALGDGPGPGRKK